MKKLLSLLLVSVMLTFSLSSISSAATIPDWKTLYQNHIDKMITEEEYYWYGNEEYLSLADLNMDGVPELIVGRSYRTAESVKGVFMIIDNKVVELTMYRDGVKVEKDNYEGYDLEMSTFFAADLYGGLKLYKHNSTGDYMYMGVVGSSSAIGSYTSYYAIELYGKSLHVNSLAFVDSERDAETNFYLKGKKVSKPKFDQYLKDYVSEYTEVSGGVYSTAMLTYDDNKGDFVARKINYDFNYPNAFAANLSPSKWAVTEVNDALKLGLIPLDMDRGYQNAVSREDMSKLAIEYLTVHFNVTRDQLLSELQINTVNNNPFTDTSSPDVILAQNIGIVSGKSDKLFAPDGSITRQEAAVLLARIAKLTDKKSSNGSVTFKDKSHIAGWAMDSVKFTTGLKDKNNGTPVMGSSGNNQFDPKGTYSREQAFITFKRLLGS